MFTVIDCSHCGGEHGYGHIDLEGRLYCTLCGFTINQPGDEDEGDGRRHTPLNGWGYCRPCQRYRKGYFDAETLNISCEECKSEEGLEDVFFSSQARDNGTPPYAFKRFGNCTIEQIQMVACIVNTLNKEYCYPPTEFTFQIPPIFFHDLANSGTIVNDPCVKSLVQKYNSNDDFKQVISEARYNLRFVVNKGYATKGFQRFLKDIMQVEFDIMDAAVDIFHRRHILEFETNFNVGPRRRQDKRKEPLCQPNVRSSSNTHYIIKQFEKKYPDFERAFREYDEHGEFIDFRTREKELIKEIRQLEIVLGFNLKAGLEMVARFLVSDMYTPWRFFLLLCLYFNVPETPREEVQPTKHASRDFHKQFDDMGESSSSKKQKKML